MKRSKQLSDFDFSLLGDFDFSGEDVWLQFHIPMPVFRELVAGPSDRELFITRKEILKLLRAIEKNPETSDSYKQTIRTLLKRA